MNDEMKNFLESEKARLDKLSEEAIANMPNFIKLKEGSNDIVLKDEMPLPSQFKDQRDFNIVYENDKQGILSVNVNSPLYRFLIECLLDHHLHVIVNRKGTTRADTRYDMVIVSEN